MPIPRHYTGSNSTTPLTPDAEAALRFLDEVVNGSEATARIDEDGSLCAAIRTDALRGLRIVIGHNWRKVEYSGTPALYLWSWDSETTPGELHAQLDGRAVERVRLLGRRSVTGALVIEGQTVAQSGRFRSPLAALLRLPDHERPIEPYKAPAYGDEVFMHAPLGNDWIVVMRRNLSDRPIEWYLQHWDQELSEPSSESQHQTEGQAGGGAELRHGQLEWERGAIAGRPSSHPNPSAPRGAPKCRVLWKGSLGPCVRRMPDALDSRSAQKSDRALCAGSREAAIWLLRPHGGRFLVAEVGLFERRLAAMRGEVDRSVRGVVRDERVGVHRGEPR